MVMIGNHKSMTMRNPHHVLNALVMGHVFSGLGLDVVSLMKKFKYFRIYYKNKSC